MQPILEVSHITKDFAPPLSLSGLLRPGIRRGRSTRAIDDLSFSVSKGSILAILGPNGAGKTTLLKILSTLILPDKGTAKVGGLTIGKDDEAIRSVIGLVASDERSFYWRLTGRQNLEFFAAMYGLGRKAAAGRIGELFDRFHIDYQDRRFNSYSAGMKKKLSFIKALLHDPEVLFLDEPTKSLDYDTSAEVRRFIKGLAAQGKTVLFATHDMAEAESLCDLFAIFNKGRVCGFGDHATLRDQSALPGGTLSDIYLRLTRHA